MCYLIQDEKPTTKKPKADMPYAEGIYFDMPEDEYHKIPYFSRSGCEDMIFDPSGEEYWHNSPMNPDYEPMQPTESMKLGTAIHTATLEPNRFESLYARYPLDDDFKGKEILKGVEDLKSFLESVGEKKTGKKEDLINRAIEYIDPKQTIIWDSLISDFMQDVESSGKRILSDSHREIIDGICASIKRKKRLPELFENFRSEITLIWKDKATNLMCKCRLDGARPEAIAEVKSFSVKGKKKSLKKVRNDTINYDMYNLQFYVYQQALQTVINKVNTGKAQVYGDVEKDWLKEFLKTPNKQFFIIYMRTQAPYQVSATELEEAHVKDATSNVYFSQAELLWKTGINSLKNCFERFGVNRFVDTDEISVLMDEDIPSIIYQSSNM